MFTFHMSLLMCENTWKIQFKCRSSFLQPNVPPFIGFGKILGIQGR